MNKFYKELVKRIQALRKSKHANSRRIKCFFAGKHKDLAHGYTEFKFLPSGDVEYWGVCAYCGEGDRKLFMERDLFDRVYTQTFNWVKVK